MYFVAKHHTFCDNRFLNIYNIGTRPPPRPPLPKKTESFKPLYPRLSQESIFTRIRMDPINPILPGVNI